MDKLKKGQKHVPGQPQKRQIPQLIDSAYVLKLLMYLIIGLLWVRLDNPNGTTVLPIPIGLFLGLIFASHEQFVINQRIEYVILIIAMFVGVLTQSGLIITY